MQNSNGEYVDLYIPRKCEATNRLIDCKDSASVQITLNTDGLNLEKQKDDQKNFIFSEHNYIIFIPLLMSKFYHLCNRLSNVAENTKTARRRSRQAVSEKGRPSTHGAFRGEKEALFVLVLASRE